MRDPDWSAMRASPRCGARTRSGKPCASPAVKGKRRCRMHGGAHGSGAPKGNQNAFQHGARSKAEIERMRDVRRKVRQFYQLLAEMRKNRRKSAK